MMKKLLFLAFLGPLLVWGQNGIIGTGFSPVQGQNIDWSTIKYFNASIQGTRILTVFPNGTGNQYFRLVRGWNNNSEQYGPVGCTDIAWNSPGIDYNLAQCWNGAFYINCPNTTDRYIFKTPGGDFPNQKFVYFRIQGAERTISSIQNTTETVYSNVAKTVSATLSGELATGQGVYLRYTTNNWSSSTVVQMSVTGTTATASIPGQSTGTTVQYYLFSSGSTGVAANGSNADFYAFNWLNNAGANYTYTVAFGGSTAASISGSNTICSGAASALKVTISGGNSPYTIVYSNGVSNVTLSNYISGTDFTVSPTSTTTYNLVSVTDAMSNIGTGNTGSATVTVNAIPTTPTITPASSTALCPGGSVVLNASGSGHQWYKNGTLLTNETSSALTASTSGAYTVISTVNGCSSSASSPMAVDMNAITAITQQPSTATQNGLGSPNLVVNATGNNLQFQWQVSTNSGTSWSDIAAPAGIANFYNPAPAVNSIYRCVVTGTCGSVTSDVSGSVIGIPTLTLSNSSCGSTLQSIGWGISASNIPNASSYMFEITSPSSSVYEVSSPDRWITLSEATGMSLLYGADYSIRVRVQSAMGTWGNYGSACTVTTPSIPITTLSTASCGATLPSLSWGISSSNVAAAAAYMFEITAPNNATPYEVTSSDRWITLSEATGMSLLYASNYSIRVKVQNGTGSWGNYGSACTVTTPSIPTVTLSTESCGATLPSIGWGISATNVASAAAYMFEITAPNNATPYEVSSADRWITLSEATGMSLLYASNYSIRVKVQNGTGSWGNYGDPCTVSTPSLPTVTLSTASCGATLPSIGWGISATNVAAATAYRFNITAPGNATPYVVTSPDRWITLSEATGMPLLYATTYSITVEVENGTGNWGAPGTACNVITPDIPTIGLSTASCGATLPSLGWGISATNVAAATQYEFEITAPSGVIYTVLSPDRWITLSEGVNTTAGNLVPANNQTYYIKVRAQSGANWGVFDTEPCSIFTPNPQGITVQDQDPQLYTEQAEGLGSEVIESQSALIENQNQLQVTWSATATSNPFEHSFKVNLNGAEAIDAAESFTAQLTDMSGKVYTLQTLNKEQLETASFGEQLSPGMYMLTLSQGTQVQVLRVVKR